MGTDHSEDPGMDRSGTSTRKIDLEGTGSGLHSVDFTSGSNKIRVISGPVWRLSRSQELCVVELVG